MRHRTVAVVAFSRRQDFQTVELAPVLLAFECEYHLFHEVIYIEDFQLDGRVVYGDGEVVCNVVAECGYGTVIVWSAPFTIQVGKPVHKDFHTVFFPVFQEKVFSGFLAASVFAVPEPSGKGCLRAAGEHHGSLVRVFFQGIKQSTCKPEVSFHELLRVFRTVDSGKVENEVTFPAPLLQLFRCGVQVVFIDFFYVKVAVAAGLAVFYVAELGAQVPSYKTLCSCNQYLHYFAMFSTPLSSFWIYSRAAILALVSSRSSLRVLSELNSVSVDRWESPSVKYLS